MLRKILCFFGIHDADLSHWGVAYGSAYTTCKYCGSPFWQSYRSQKRAQARYYKNKEANND